MPRFAIYSRTDTDSSIVKKKIKTALLDANWVYDDEKPELVIVIGGDGKMLRAVHHYLYRLADTAFIGINTGTLGFFADYNKNEVKQLIEDLLHGERYEEACPILKVIFHYDDHEEVIYSVNEVRIEHPLRAMDLEVYVNGVLLEKYVGNGACVASPAGSTGYLRSLGGAMVERDLNILEFMEIIPVANSMMHSLRNALIIDGHKTITLVSDNFGSVYISTDYISKKRAEFKKISIKLASKKLRFVHYRNYPFLERLRDKII